MSSKKKEPFTQDDCKKCLTSIKQAVKEYRKLVGIIGEPFRPIDEESYLKLQCQIVDNADRLKENGEYEIEDSYAKLIRAAICVVGDTVDKYGVLFDESPFLLDPTKCDEDTTEDLEACKNELTFFLEIIERTIIEYCIYTEIRI